MVSSVTLGNFFTTSTGKTVLGGSGGSGLDTQALLKSLVDAKSLPATQDQTQITKNDKISGALTTFQTLLSAFQGSVDALRSAPGVGNDANNAFKFTSASVTSDTGTAGNYMTVATAPGAALQSYEISEVTSLASAASQNSDVFNVASADASVVPPASGTVMFGAGTITINGQDITINDNDSLNNIAAKFNGVSSATGINATVIRIDDTHYQLSFVATKTGTVGNFDLSTVSDPNSALTHIGLSVAKAGTIADFKINGVEVTRQSNAINDVISGVTFNLLQKTSGAKLTVSVQPDTQTVQSSINNFVASYNAIKSFAAQQTQTKSDGTYADTALLATNITFRSLMNDITSQVSGQVSGLTGINSLASIGITLTTQPATSTLPAVDNILTVDDGKLSSALTTNFSDVSALFGLSQSSNNTNVRIFSATNAVGVNQLTLNAVPSTNTFTATYTSATGPVTVNLTSKALPGDSGYSLTGPAGTPLEGLVLLYASTSPGTATVNITQGIAAQTYNTSQSALAYGTGTLSLALTGIQDTTTRLNSDITQINAQVALYQDQMLAKFSALEQAISKVNTLLQGLSANTNAALVASGH